jgi:hypothetical protein
MGGKAVCSFPPPLEFLTGVTQDADFQSLTEYNDIINQSITSLFTLLPGTQGQKSHNPARRLPERLNLGPPCYETELCRRMGSLEA